MADLQKPENQALIEAVERLALQANETQTITAPDGQPLAFLQPNSKQWIKAKPLLDELRDYPERRTGTATFTELASFIAHTKRFAKLEKSVIFADVDPDAETAKLTCVVDYHGQGYDSKADWLRHRSTYAFPFSPEWQAWSGKDGVEMDQRAFAEFIEANIQDVISPSDAGPGILDFTQRLAVECATPAALLQVSRGLQVRVNDRVHQAVTLASGECQVQYVTEHQDQAGAPLKVPGAFLLGLPVFRGGDAFQVAARLRYRVNGPKITWLFELWKPERCVDIAVKEAAEKTATETGLPVLFGSPEK